MNMNGFPFAGVGGIDTLLEDSCLYPNGMKKKKKKKAVRRCGYCGTGRIKGLMHDTFSGFEKPHLVPICDGCLQEQYGGKKIKALSSPEKRRRC